MINKMNSSNLACVFGLNLIWPSQGTSSLSALLPLNLFTELLIEYYETIFSAQEALGDRGPGSGDAGGQGSHLVRGCGGTEPPQPSPGLSGLRVP